MRSLKRALAGLLGFILLASAAVMSSGIALLAPLGVLAARAVMRRRGRVLTRGTAWLGAMGAVVAGGLILALVVFSRIPPETVSKFGRTFSTTVDSSMAASRKQPPPAWMERVSPGATARNAAVSARPVGAFERGFMIWSGVVGAGLGVGILAAMVATLAWVATLLIAYALRGAWY